MSSVNLHVCTSVNQAWDDVLLLGEPHHMTTLTCVAGNDSQLNKLSSYALNSLAPRSRGELHEEYKRRTLVRTLPSLMSASK